MGRRQAVHGDHLPLLDEQPVADPDLLDRDGPQRSVLVAVGGARRASEQRRELAARSVVGERLERAAAREHQGDDRPGQVLAQCERRRHREQRDQVDARPPVQHASDRREQQRNDPDRRGRGPQRLGGPVGAGQRGDPTAAQTRGRDG